MEVDKTEFKKLLLPILRNLSSAAFIAFDLEMSGITTRPKYGPNDRARDVSKPSLQQQYEEMKAAAEKYQVLQLGITCVEEDRDKEYYLARPYNFYMTPLSSDGVDLKLERNFTFSSSACDFLSKNGFKFDKVFSSGVSYLSQEEEKKMNDHYTQHADKMAQIPDIVISSDETSTLEFYRDARKTISSWMKNLKPENDFVNIGSSAGALNGYQRRLVYQLVRSEFPTLRAFARDGGHFMQVEKLVEKKESEFQKGRFQRFNHQIAKQKGLSWIFEALSGGDLSGIKPDWFCDSESETYVKDLESTTAELEQIRKNLKATTVTIVGHNLFTDLGFLYSTFVGPLPLSVRDFQRKIHKAFPAVVDTKYLATHEADSMNPRVGLKDLLSPFKTIHMPLIVLHECHNSYGSPLGKDHEAGFDSWMTAELFVKLTAKLYAQRKPRLEVESNGLAGQSLQKIQTSDSSSDPDSEGGVRVLRPHKSVGPFALSLQNNLPPKWHEKQLNPDPVLKDVLDKSTLNASQWLPDITNAFWDIYANKLRVNASEGGVCDLEED